MGSARCHGEDLKHAGISIRCTIARVLVFAMRSSCVDVVQKRWWEKRTDHDAAKSQRQNLEQKASWHHRHCSMYVLQGVACRDASVTVAGRAATYRS
jgi:hypothetical protein